MSESDDALGPVPDASVEEPARFPGGADAIADEEKYGELPDEPVVPDLHPDANPATDSAPVELGEPDDKEQAGDGDDADAGTEEPAS